MQLRITVENVKEAMAEIATLARKCRDLSPVLDHFGVHMVRSIQDTFDAGGPPNKPWPPSIRFAKKGGHTLIDSGDLKNSFVRAVVNPHTLTVGTNIRYAAVHQFGYKGTVQIPEHLRLVKTRDVYQKQARISKKGNRYTAKVNIGSGFAVVKAHATKMNIPPRPFLVIKDSDMEIFAEMLRNHLKTEK